MKTLTAPATAAAARTYAAPVYLLRLDFTTPVAKTLYLSDRTLVLSGQEYLPLVASWGTLDSALNVLDVDGSPGTATLTFFNTVPLENRARLSDLILTPLNTAGTYEWAFARVTVSQLFENQAAADSVLLGVFFLEEPTEISDELLTVRMSDQSLAIEDRLRITRVGRTEFPECNTRVVGQSIPRIFGTLKGVTAVQVIDAARGVLDGAITVSATSLTLYDATDFPSPLTAHTVQIETEWISYTGKSGNTLTGLTRGTSGTTAAPHVHGTAVHYVREGGAAYRFLVGEHVGNYKIRSISNVLVDGALHPLVSPSLQLEDTTTVPGKNFAAIVLPQEAQFHQLGSTTAERDIAVSTITTVLNSNVGVPPGPITRTVAPSSIGSTNSTVRSLNAHITRSGNLVGPVSWALHRQLAGGSPLQVAGGTWAAFTGGTVNFSDVKTYVSVANEILTLHFVGGDWNDGLLTLVFDNYHVKDSAAVLVGGGPTSIGVVTCDVEGIQDDASGTLTGTAAALLENPADVTRFLLTELYGVSAADLGASWTTTHTKLAGAGYRWASVLTYQTFSRLRRQLGEQARSVLYLEAGRWEYQFLDDVPTAPVTLDYERDVWEGLPATVRRTNRTDIKNSLTVSARHDALLGRYRYLKLFEDLSVVPTPQAAELVLDWVQDSATADALGAYWLSRWAQAHFEVELAAWWNLLAVEKIDAFRIANHPGLEAHGGAALVFRIVGRQDDLANNRIQLQGVEMALLPAPRAPEPGEDMAFNCRLVYVSSSSIRLDPYDGNQIRVIVGGSWAIATVPNAGITKDTSGTSASTLYYVYVYDNAGVLALELSTTGHARDSATGIRTKSGDTTRTLVGQVYVNGAGQFQSDTTGRLVSSYFNRRGLTMVGVFTTPRSTTSATFVEVNAEIRCYFVTWADEPVSALFSGRNAPNVTSNAFVTVSFDGGVTETFSGNDNATASAGCTCGITATLGEGFHYATVLALCTGGNTITLAGSAGPGSRDVLNVQVQG